MKNFIICLVFEKNREYINERKIERTKKNLKSEEKFLKVFFFLKYCKSKVQNFVIKLCLYLIFF